MTPGSINRACAELCGWEPQPEGTFHPDNPVGQIPPSFTTSLDSAQMAFKALTKEQQDVAEFTLWKIARKPIGQPMFFMGCTPPQWCEAILKAAGKWEESK